MDERFEEKWEMVAALPILVRNPKDTKSIKLGARIVTESYFSCIAQLGREAVEALNLQETTILRVFDDDEGPLDLTLAELEISFKDTKILGPVLINTKHNRSYVFEDFLIKIPDECIPSYDYFNEDGVQLIDHDNLEIIINGLHQNRDSIRYISETILHLLPEEREKVRGSNELTAEQKTKKVEALNQLEALVSELLAVILNEKTLSELKGKNVASWISRYKTALEDNFDRLVDPGNLANATVPTAIILSCGALGALVGGPVGFGAGSVLGHLITGQMKPGAVAKKLEETIREDAVDREN